MKVRGEKKENKKKPRASAGVGWGAQNEHLDTVNFTRWRDFLTLNDDF